MNRDEPLVSVIITVFNREKYLSEAIESVLSNNYQNFEVIVVDDTSSDSSVEIARHYEKIDSRIKVFLNKFNLGDYPNRNKAISYAKGKYILFVDSDDCLLKDGLKDSVEVMESFPNSKFGVQFNSNHKNVPFFLNNKDVIYKHFFEYPCLMMGPGGTILNREFFNSIGCYPTKYGPANDMYFNLKAASTGGVVFLPFEINNYRIHEGQEINNKYSYLFNNYLYLRDAVDELDLFLSDNQKKYLLNKNKRRFIVNVVRFAKKSKNIKLTFNAIRLADFKFYDFLNGLFHF